MPGLILGYMAAVINFGFVPFKVAPRRRPRSAISQDYVSSCIQPPGYVSHAYISETTEGKCDDSSARHESVICLDVSPARPERHAQAS